jgi:transcriptional regulator with XRE-family HTH domain
VEIGASLRKLREKRGLTLEDIADKANVSAGHISRWELGTRNLDLADYVKLCDILEVQPGDLLPHTEGVELRYQPLVAMLRERSDRDLQRIMKVVAVMFDDAVPASLRNGILKARPSKGKTDEPVVIVNRPKTQVADDDATQPRARARRKHHRSTDARDIGE